MEYKVDDRQLDAALFIPFANQVWPGEYDEDKTQHALSRTMNITAYDGKALVGCLRILSDGYYFGTITELLVLPAYQGRDVYKRQSCGRKKRSTTFFTIWNMWTKRPMRSVSSGKRP